MIFMFVLLVAVGAEAYVTGQQSQSAVAVQQALQVADQRGSEKITFFSSAGNVYASNSGPVTAKVATVLLRFANGSVFTVPGDSPVPSGASLLLQPLVGSGNCGSTSCLKRYNAIASGAALGSVGLLTSLGNTFWYVPSAGGSSGVQTYWTSGLQSTTSTTFVRVAGLSFAGTQGAKYEVTLIIGYYQSATTAPGISIGFSVPSGTTLLACGGIQYPDAPLGCTTSANTPIGATIFPGNSQIQANYCTVPSSPCVYAATLLVAMGSASGTCQVVFEVSGTTTGTVTGDSFMQVSPG